MHMNAHLFFDGKCAEALAFYEKALGAKVLMRMSYDQSPVPVSGDRKGQVMHARFAVGETVVMAADGPGGGKFEGFALNVGVADEQEARRVFDALAAGGTVKMPLGPTFFSKAFGMVTDKFGVGWMVMVHAPV